MRVQPIVFIWKHADVADADGVVELQLVMVPATARYAAQAAKQFGEEGTEHVLGPVEERNMRFHNWYFAALHEAWQNLPETVAVRWPSENHFRKWLLTNRTEFFDETEITVIDEENARALMAHVRVESPYASIYGPRPTNTGGFKVIIRKPHSQSVREMGKERFEESAKQVLDAACEFVGVPRGTLLKNAGRAA